MIARFTRPRGVRTAAYAAFRRSVVRSSEARLAVMVHSFDGYKRFQRPCIHLLRKYLPNADCIHLAIEKVVLPEFSDLHIIRTGSGDFMSRMSAAILHLATAGYTHVLYLQEDIWISEILDFHWLSRLAEEMHQRQLSCLKLGWGACWPDERGSLAGMEAFKLGQEEFLHYGNHSYPVSHHPSVYDVPFLLWTIRWSLRMGARSGIQHEICSQGLLKDLIKTRDADSAPITIGIWKDRPPVSYTHASVIGTLTPEGSYLLEQEGISHLYSDSLPGEVFPVRR